MLELGNGFSFVGKQIPLKIDGDDYFIDLLFYHIKLRCYIVVELKSGKYKAEFAGKMNLYLSAVDDLIRTEDENPSIGLLLCKEKSEIVAEYSLRGTSQPMGIAEYEIINSFPKKLTANLPSIEEIEKELTTSLNFEF